MLRLDYKVSTLLQKVDLGLLEYPLAIIGFCLDKKWTFFVVGVTFGLLVKDEPNYSVYNNHHQNKLFLASLFTIYLALNYLSIKILKKLVKRERPPIPGKESTRKWIDLRSKKNSMESMPSGHTANTALIVVFMS